MRQYVPRCNDGEERKQQPGSDETPGGEHITSDLSVDSPIRKASGHQTRMDKVEPVLVYPLVFCIIDDELEIRWHPIAKDQFGSSLILGNRLLTG